MIVKIDRFTHCRVSLLSHRLILTGSATTSFGNFDRDHADFLSSLAWLMVSRSIKVTANIMHIRAGLASSTLIELTLLLSRLGRHYIVGVLMSLPISKLLLEGIILSSAWG